MKLSKTQQEVIDLMKNDWELGTSMSGEHHSWLQKGGLGKGGESKTVSSATVHALYRKGLIKSIDVFPTRKYYIRTITL